MNKITFLKNYFYDSFKEALLLYYLELLRISYFGIDVFSGYNSKLE